MENFHQRRPKQNVDDWPSQCAIIVAGQVLTMAMAMDGEPYLATVNYGFNEAERTFYFHCHPKGKKYVYLRHNPVVWCQITEDLGYRVGECAHNFRSVQFRAEVRFLDDLEEKRSALFCMIDALEPDPGPVKERLVTDKSLEKVAVVALRAEDFTGKMSKPEQ